MKQDTVAVIDVGSNSVRLVIYDAIKRSPFPIFNEKVLCGLAKNMAQTGMLDKDGVKEAYICIGRFIRLTEVMAVKQVFLFATSAVRDAEDGHAFVEKLEKDFKHKVMVLAGDQEARYGGLGILASIETPDGVAADLGGGSLELVGIKGDKLLSGEKSYPLGPMRISADRRKLSVYKREVAEALSDFPLKQYAKGKAYYLIGGAFRGLAKMHMTRKQYPLKVLHHYIVDAKELYQTLEVVSKMSDQALTGLQDIPEKRSKMLPFAASLAMQLIELGQPKDIVFSTFGVREGILYEQLTAAQQKKDPLIEGCIDMAKAIGREPEYGCELAEWLSPLFKEVSPARQRVILATCILSDIACHDNAEYRAQMAYRKVLDSSLIALTHRERAFMAQALYHRYRFNGEDIPDEPIMFLLDKYDLTQAKLLGTAMRLARSLSGSHVGILQHIHLSFPKEKIQIAFAPGYSRLYGEKIAKRLSQLAMVLKVKVSVKK